MSAAESDVADNQVVCVSSPDYSTESAGSVGDVNVSAADNNDILSAGINSNDVLSEESDVGTYSDLDKLIRLTTSGTTLRLYQDYEYNNDTDKIFNTSGITITKSIIIDGNGHTISGNNITMGFTVNASDVTLSNLNFVRMTKTFSWFGENGRVLNSNFKTPTINWYGDNCVIENSTFRDLLNKDLFFLENNDFLVKGCTFSNITCTSNGIIFSFLDANDCKIVNCTFLNCSNTGSSIYRGILSFYGVSSIINSSFISCGGRNNLIFSSTADVLVNNSYFNDITANRVFSAESTGIKFYNCIFYNTTNTLARTDSKTPSLDSGSIVYNCTFIRNRGNWAICTGGTGVNISNSKFYNNTGCIYSNFAYTFIENCEFKDNLGYNGGVVYLNNNNSIVNNCSFSNSTSYDIWIKNNVTTNMDSKTASANISGNITPFVYYDYLIVDNHTNGDGVNTPCNISWAIKNVAYGGTIFIKNGVYNMTGMQSISCNVLGESRDGVIINNGSFQMFIPYAYVKNITFNHMQQSFQIYNSCTLTDCRFINFNKTTVNMITTRNYAYLHEIKNILVENSSFNYFYQHGTAAQAYGFIWDNISFQNCSFKYLTSDGVVTYSSFSNIIVNNSNFTACFFFNCYR